MHEPGGAGYKVSLVPGESILQDGDRLVASSATPWLEIHFATDIPAGCWIVLTWRSSFLDRLVRPVLRFVTTNGDHYEILAAALLGRGEWIGLVPEGTRRVFISPVDQPGPFGFEIEQCRCLKTMALLAHAWSRDKGRTAEAVVMGTLGRRRAMQRLLRGALGSTPLERYHAWRALRLRPYDPAGLDAPRSGWDRGPHIRIVVDARKEGPDGLHSLLMRLAHQAWPHWSVICVCKDAAQRASTAISSDASHRVRYIASTVSAVTLLEGIPENALLGVVGLDDKVPDYALPVLVTHAMQRPAASFFYGDEDSVDDRAHHVCPRLKPDWSPAFQAAGRYVGMALFVRAERLARRGTEPVGDVIGEARWRTLPDGAGPQEVEHVRRILVSRRTLPATLPASAVASARAADENRAATIIIPNKDKSYLLAGCVRSLRHDDMPAGTELVIVDNGSVEPATRLLYDALTSDPRVRVIERPGPFNFSRLCNEAAREARAPVLVFLNNDVEAIEGNWFRPLLSWAVQSDVGAVGARLLYPSGRLQHGGVVIGLRGHTAHVDLGAPGDDPGYLGRRAGPHELSAVTAACLAVEKSKFEAVGGFDAEHLPVELNDMDLCLRLAERGWRTILAPGSVLLHHESASRGTATACSDRYPQEREFFSRRWAARLRDDPYFHPALSLVSIRTALG